MAVLQENGLLVIKYFVTKIIHFVSKYISQRKVFRIMFVDVYASLKVSQRNLCFRYPIFFLIKFIFVNECFPQLNISSLKVVFLITKKKKIYPKNRQ